MMRATFLLLATGVFAVAKGEAIGPTSGAAKAGAVVNLALGAMDPSQDLKEEMKKRQDALNPNDVAGHYDLAVWAEQNNLKTESKRLLRKVIKLDPNHEKAREKLGYKMFEGKWRTDAEIARLQREKEEQAMRAKGLVRWQGQWVAKEIAGNLERGLIFYGTVRTKSGETIKGAIENWIENAPVKVTNSSGTREIALQDLEGVEADWMTPEQRDRKERGLVLHENEWLSPEEITKRKDGQFLCDGKWVSVEEANSLHSDLAKGWVFESEYVMLQTNCAYDVGKSVLKGANDAYRATLQRLGLEVPAEAKLKARIVLVNSDEEYNQFGQSVQDDQDAAKSSAYPYFCHLDPVQGGYLGIVSFALTPDYTKYMGMQAASELAVRGREFGETVPRWFTEGISCAEGRCFDPRLAKWTVENLRGKGGLSGLGNFFDPFVFSQQSILQAGVLVVYVRDPSADPKVKEAYQAVLHAMKTEKNQGLEKAFRNLEKVLEQNEKKILDFMDSLEKS